MQVLFKIRTTNGVLVSNRKKVALVEAKIFAGSRSLDDFLHEGTHVCTSLVGSSRAGEETNDTKSNRCVRKNSKAIGK